MEYRKINQYIVGKKTLDGAGVNLKRCFGFYEIPDFDPYLLLDFFDSKNPDDYTKGFPWHPHRGLETITYIIKGAMYHEDSIGNSGRISDGDLQWMSAGSGVLHTEMPEAVEHMLGVQLWLNLSKKDKMKEPEYREIKAEEVKVYNDDEKTIKIIAGEYKDLKGPMVLPYADPVYLDIELKPNVEFSIEVKEGHNYFAFVVDGEANFNYRSNRFIEKGLGVLFEREGDRVKINTNDIGGRFILVGGIPYDEPISWGGPIVMNTKEEITQAFREYKEGTFVKNKK